MYRAAIITKGTRLGVITERDEEVAFSLDGAVSSATLEAPQLSFEVLLAIARLRGWRIGYVGQLNGEIISCQRSGSRSNAST